METDHKFKLLEYINFKFDNQEEYDYIKKKLAEGIKCPYQDCFLAHFFIALLKNKKNHEMVDLLLPLFIKNIPSEEWLHVSYLSDDLNNSY